MGYDFRGRVVLVTGASSGIGQATAEAFARAGASVVLTGRNTDRLKEVAAALGSTEGKLFTQHLDVTNREQVFAVIEKAAKDLGRLDILINNAGIGHCLRFEELKWEDIQQIVDTNVMGIVHALQAVTPLMRQRGSGQIVNVASTAGLKGIPLMSIYSATKFAVRGLSESLRMELKKDGIEVIIVSPGTTDTKFFDRAVTNGKGWTLKRPWTRGPETVAKQILRACAYHKRELILTPEGKMMVLLNKFAPGFVDYMTMKAAARE
jgi:short-subunit dehydrogenase